MNILITGALGHIGSSLITRLNEIKNLKKIYVIDSLRSNNINVLFNLKVKKIKIKFIKADLIDQKTLNRVDDKINFVVHLASITNAEASFKIKKELFQNNFGIFKNIVKWCIKKKAKLIHLSSTSVYGLQSELVDEKLKKLSPQSPYAESKLKEEEFLKKHRDSMSYICLRFGTIYGFSVGMRFHTAVNKFCWQAANNQQLTVWKTAFDQKRPYLDLKDACRSIIFLIKNNSFNNEVYNVLTHNLSVRDVVNVLKGYKPKLKVKFVNNKIMNQLSYDVSNKKFQELGFKFNGNLDRSIKKTLENLLNSI